MKKNKSGKLITAIKSSFFVSILNKFSDLVYEKITTSLIARFFTLYESIEKKAEKSFVKKLINRIKPKTKTFIKIKNRITTRIENSFLYNKYKNISNVLLGTKCKAYGLFLFIYGFFSAGLGLMQKFSLQLTNIDGNLWIQGVFVMIFSIPFLISKEKIGVLLAGGVISSKVIRFLDIKSEKLIKEEEWDNAVIPVTLALLAGMFSLIVKPLYLIGAIFAILIVNFIFKKPEFGVLAIIVFLPFTPTMLICAEIIFVFIAYIFKVMRGKRSFKLDILDITILIFSGYMFLGGVCSVTPLQSVPPACVYLCFLSSYFLIINLIKTTKFLKKILSCSAFTFFLTSAYGVFQNFFGAPDTTWTDEDMFSEIETRVVSTFENPNVFGEYLILLIPVVVALLLCSQSPIKKFSYLFTLATSLAALVYTWSRGAWLGFILALLILFVIITKKAVSVYALGLISLPVIIPFLPSSILERFSSIGNMTDSSTSYRVFIWEASVNMIKDFFITGIGIGTGAFQTVYSEYALAGIETAPHSHNLYLQILVEIGVFGFAVFIISMLLFFTKCFTFMKNTDKHHSRLILGGLICAIIAFLVQGLTDYVWYNYRVFGFFWMMLGIAVSYINSYSNENADNNNYIF